MSDKPLLPGAREIAATLNQKGWLTSDVSPDMRTVVVGELVSAALEEAGWGEARRALTLHVRATQNFIAYLESGREYPGLSNLRKACELAAAALKKLEAGK